MSNTTTTPTEIKISNPDEFRKVAASFGLKVGDRGRLPKLNLLAVLVPEILSGKVRLIPTDFFSTDTAKNEITPRGTTTYEISYRVVNKNGKLMPNVIRLTLTTKEIRELLPNIKGQVNVALATMLVALYRAGGNADAPLTDLLKYAVQDVRKVTDSGDESDAEDTNEPAEGDDTAVDGSDADSVSESAGAETTDQAQTESELVNA